MKINNIKGSAILSEKTYIKNEYIAMQLKFFHVSDKELDWIWKVVKKEFYDDLREQFFMRFESEDENIKEKQLDHFLDKKSDENDLSAEGEYKDSRFGKIRSFSGTEKFFDKRYDTDLEDEDPETIEKPLKGRRKFKTDEAFVEYVRDVMKKDSFPMQVKCVYPDIVWGFHAERCDESDDYYGYLSCSVAGELFDFQYDEVAQELQKVFWKISAQIKQVTGNIYLIPDSVSSYGPPYSELFAADLSEKYDVFPDGIFLLGGIEWFNYVPYDLLNKYELNFAENKDNQVILKKSENGYSFIINKSIAEVTVEDRKHMRKNYLDSFLMKAPAVLVYDLEDEQLKEQGQNVPLFDEELQLHVENWNGRKMYGIKYVPMVYPSILM